MGYSEELPRNMAELRADWLNYSAPSRSVAFRVVPRCVFCIRWLRVFRFPQLGVGNSGWGWPARKISGNSGEPPRNMAELRADWLNYSAPSRSVAFRVVPRFAHLPAVGAVLFLCCSAELHRPSTHPPTEIGRKKRSGPKSLRNFTHGRQKPKGSKGDWSNFLSIICVPWCVALLQSGVCCFCSYACRRPPRLGWPTRYFACAKMSSSSGRGGAHRNTDTSADA